LENPNEARLAPKQLFAAGKAQGALQPTVKKWSVDSDSDAGHQNSVDKVVSCPVSFLLSWCWGRDMVSRVKGVFMDPL
jgi:hypothetical protein